MFISKPRCLYTTPTQCQEDAEEHLDAVAKIAANTSRNDLTTQMTSTSASTSPTPMSETTTAEPFMQQEEWQTVNHDTLRDDWEISTLWRMRNRRTGELIQTSLLKPDISSGYHRKGIHHYAYYVHILLALTFIPNPYGLPWVDHKDRNKLNNHIWNLRWCTKNQNAWNNTAFGGTSRHKGVCWDRRRKKWAVKIKCYNKGYYLGRYTDENQAALQYNAHAMELFGEFAVLNDVDPRIKLLHPYTPRVKSSRYHNVSWDKESNKWKAYIKLKGRLINLGRFDDEDDAARAYNKRALAEFGADADLIVID